jgi:hypothetical protein
MSVNEVRFLFSKATGSTDILCSEERLDHCGRVPSITLKLKNLQYIRRTLLEANLSTQYKAGLLPQDDRNEQKILTCQLGMSDWAILAEAP